MIDKILSLMGIEVIEELDINGQIYSQTEYFHFNHIVGIFLYAIGIFLFGSGLIQKYCFIHFDAYSKLFLTVKIWIGLMLTLMGFVLNRVGDLFERQSSVEAILQAHNSIERVQK